jgi:WXG100 family type VII secretion target
VSGIDAEMEGFHQLTRRLTQAEAAIRSILDELDAASRQLEGGVTGSAARAFADARRSWSAQLDELTAVLAAATAAAESARERYERAEQAAASAW